MDLVKVETTVFGNTYSVEVFIPDTLKEAVAKYGEDTVYTFLRTAMLQRSQRKLSSVVKSPQTPQEDIERAFMDWTPFSKRTRREKGGLTRGFVEKLQRLTPEQRQQLLRELMSNDEETEDAIA